MTKRQLILIRHTKSSWADLGMRDFDRPLKKDRTDDAKNMAKHLTELGVKPDLILCSPALRTKQTVEFFCEKLNYDYNKIEFDMRLYESSAEDYTQVVRETDEQIRTLVVVGHNPSISDFANQFLQSKISEVPTTGVVCLEFEIDNWEIYRATPCELKYFLTPKAI
jgi:phosphohistidine phosphatase